MTPDDHQRRQAPRVMRLLAAEPACVEQTADERSVLLRNRLGAIRVAASLLARLAQEGVIRQRQGKIEASDAIAALAPSERHAATARTAPAGPVPVVNPAESPLSLLARLKDRNGRAFLGDAEFDAGEKLRSDYTRGRIMPRLGVNWDANAACRGSGGSDGLADLTDAALAARQRVDRALSAVGPELSGLLVDVCCFLKGLELVERERGWPVRSAKVVLKTALAALARHYDPPGARRRNGRSLHWGTEDFRPSFDGTATGQGA